MGRRTEREAFLVRSGHVLSETAGAKGLPGQPLNSEAPRTGRGRHRRGRPGFSPWGTPYGQCGSNHLSGVGFAHLRGQAQVVAALEFGDSRGAACATGGRKARRPEMSARG